METKTTVHIPVRKDRISRLPLPISSRDKNRGSRRHKKEMNKSSEMKREDPIYVDSRRN